MIHIVSPALTFQRKVIWVLRIMVFQLRANSDLADLVVWFCVTGDSPATLQWHLPPSLWTALCAVPLVWKYFPDWQIRTQMPYSEDTSYPEPWISDFTGCSIFWVAMNVGFFSVIVFCTDGSRMAWKYRWRLHSSFFSGCCENVSATKLPGTGCEELFQKIVIWLTQMTIFWNNSPHRVHCKFVALTFQRKVIWVLRIMGFQMHARSAPHVESGDG